MKNILIYQAYGIEDILNECIYSISTLTPFNVEIDHIVIYTDNPSYLKLKLTTQFQYKFKKLEGSLIKEWRGGNNFVHRVKIKMLHDYISNDLSNLSKSYNLLYLDTDTTFIKSPNYLFDKIGDGILIMHDNEGVINANRKNLIFKRLSNYLEKRFKEKGDIPADHLMFNAGVLGFQNSDENLLNEVLALTDDIYEEYPQHVSEQLAFSVIFSSQTGRTLELAKEEIFHYWSFKDFRIILKEFFAKNNTPELILSKLKNIDPQVLHQPKLEYESLGFLKKNWRKLFGKWQFPDYEI